MINMEIMVGMDFVNGRRVNHSTVVLMLKKMNSVQTFSLL